MREIKFLAWDAKHEKWMWPYPEPFWIIGEMTVFDCLKQAEDMSIQDYNEIKSCQYIGKKDKNGKEIYEGFILLFDNGYGQGIEVVEWDDRTCGFAPFSVYDIDCDEWSKAEECEIIGNIYENPELLKA